MTDSPTRRLNILFTTQPATGHLRPLIPVALAAQRRGHRVAVLAPARIAAEVRGYGVTHLGGGYDFGVGGLALGVDLEATKTTLKAIATDDEDSGDRTRYQLKGGLDLYAGLRATFAATDNILFYVKGGGAWLQSDFDVQAAGTAFGTVSDTRRGWTVGVGGEYAFVNWISGFVEWDYYQFRDSVANLNCTLAVPCRGLTTLPVNVDANVNVIKAGVNLRFGPGVRY